MANESEDFKRLEKQTKKWTEQIENGNYERVTAEVAVASYMMIYNIDQNLTLIRDILIKRMPRFDVDNF